MEVGGEGGGRRVVGTKMELLAMAKTSGRSLLVKEQGENLQKRLLGLTLGAVALKSNGGVEGGSKRRG